MPSARQIGMQVAVTLVTLAIVHQLRKNFPTVQRLIG